MERAGVTLLPLALLSLRLVFQKLKIFNFILPLVAVSGAAHASVPTPSHTNSRPTLLLVIGAPGQPEYATNFSAQAQLWQKAAAQSGTRVVSISTGESCSSNDLACLQQSLAAESKDSPAPLWLVLIGHGSFDGKEARFNLRGPDLSATDLAQWLRPFHRPLAIINTAAASAPFMAKLSATNRVIITATRSGSEQNFAHFGQYLAESISNPEADLDKDGQVSLLEAFLMASRKTAEFYKTENRLATEHALLDDNGDGLGTPADWFVGLRAVKKPKESKLVDGLLAQQFHFVSNATDSSLTPEERAKRNTLERAVLLHREKKNQMPEEAYYRELEKLLLDLARFDQKKIAPTNGPSLAPKTN